MKLGGGGKFSKPFFFYRYLHYTDPGKRKKRNIKELENHEIAATIQIPIKKLVDAFGFPMIKKIIAFCKSNVETLKSIFDGTLVNTEIKLLRYVRC